MTSQAIGEAIIKATNTGFIKSLDNNVVTPDTEAPNTFRIPISLFRLAAVKEAKPYKLRQAINMANPEKDWVYVVASDRFCKACRISDPKSCIQKGIKELLYQMQLQLFR